MFFGLLVLLLPFLRAIEYEFEDYWAELQNRTEEPYEPIPKPSYPKPTHDASTVNPKYFDRAPPDELTIETIVPARRCTRRVRKSDEVEISYKIITYRDMKVMDYTEPTEAYVFRVGYGETIKGVDEGIIGCCVGETRRLTFPPSMGYGSNGSGPIKPDEPLIVELTLTDMIARSWDDAYQRRAKSLADTAKSVARTNLEGLTQPPFQRPVRHTVTIPKEGLEAKGGVTQKRIKAIPYPRFVYEPFDHSRENYKKRHVKRKGRAWKESRHYARGEAKLDDYAPGSVPPEVREKAQPAHLREENEGRKRKERKAGEAGERKVRPKKAEEPKVKSGPEYPPPTPPAQKETAGEKNTQEPVIAETPKGPAVEKKDAEEEKREEKREEKKEDQPSATKAETTKAENEEKPEQVKEELGARSDIHVDEPLQDKKDEVEKTEL
ncbi:hypothetical protein BLNAU_434 [Blattamonas nauphoetae]|uniref:peptidylprolyl isomerase n=1 Tax=Blattamonas nauphoetae TaxID=2049346 RepID=A0ABQ9YL87_9EUKA|nr:hypothetical protein BLNAU_434 [Blattamonas nauphoetae]